MCTSLVEADSKASTQTHANAAPIFKDQGCTSEVSNISVCSVLQAAKENVTELVKLPLCCLRTCS